MVRLFTRYTIAFAISVLFLSCAGSAQEQLPHGLIYQTGITVILFDTVRETKRILYQSAHHAVGLSSDLQQIAHSTDSSDLWVSDIDGKNARQVITDQFHQAKLVITRVSWAPKGQRIAVFATPVEFPEQNGAKFALYVVDLDKNTLRIAASGISDFTWMPDGKQIALIKKFDPNDMQGIYLIDSESLAEEQLLKKSSEPFIVASPINAQLAFVAPETDNSYQLTLFVYDLKSGNVVDLLQDSSIPLRDISDPVWSPDGERIAFVAEVPVKDNKSVSALFTIDTRTHLLTHIVDGVRGPLIWSPDGNSIAAPLMSSTEGIYEIKLATGQTKKLTDDQLSAPAVLDWR